MKLEVRATKLQSSAAKTALEFTLGLRQVVEYYDERVGSITDILITVWQPPDS